MTGLNLSIKLQDGSTKPYGILYSEFYGFHIAQVIDETVSVEKQITKATKEECVEELIEYINSIGIVTTMKVNTPDDFLIDSIKKLRGQ